MRFALLLCSVVALTAALLLPARQVAAHKPMFLQPDSSSLQNAVLIPNHRISWSVYGRLERANQIDYYKFEGRKGEPFYAHLLVPQVASLAGYRPSLALVGPGLPKHPLPPGLPADWGAVVIDYTGPQRELYEGFTQTRYYDLQVLRRELPADGSYTIWVFHPEGRPGTYNLVVGEREEFTVQDILLFPVHWLRVHLWMFASAQLPAAGAGGATAGAAHQGTAHAAPPPLPPSTESQYLTPADHTGHGAGAAPSTSDNARRSRSVLMRYLVWAIEPLVLVMTTALIYFIARRLVQAGLWLARRRSAATGAAPPAGITPSRAVRVAPWLLVQAYGVAGLWLGGELPGAGLLPLLQLTGLIAAISAVIGLLAVPRPTRATVLRDYVLAGILPWTLALAMEWPVRLAA